MGTDPTPGQHQSVWGTPRTEPPWALTLRGGLVLLLVFLAVVALGAVAVRRTMYPAADIAERIRASGSDLIVRVDYQGPNPFEGAPDYVRVYLRHDTPEAVANDFWCHVVVPAGGADLPKNRVVVGRDAQQAGERWDLVPDPICLDSAPIR